MGNDRLQMAIVGYGGMGAYHVHLAHASDRIRVKGVFDIDDGRLRLASESGLVAYPSFTALLADREVAIVLIATPNDVHKTLAIRALEAGKHVICEKPVALTVDEFKAMMAVADEMGRMLIVHQNRRWDEDFLTVRRLWQEKRIGDIFHVESRVQGANGIPGDWRHCPTQGGGMLLDWGVHLLDQLLLLDDSEIDHVYASLSYVLGHEVDDGFTAHIAFKSGLTAHIEVGTTNFIKLPRWYVKGTEGNALIADWDLSGGVVMCVRESVTPEPVPIQAGVGLTKTMAPPNEDAVAEHPLPAPLHPQSSFYNNVAQAILEGEAPMVKNDEVLRVMNLMAAIVTASHERRVVEHVDSVR